MSVEVRAARPDDRVGLCAVVTSDATFKPEEVTVAIELIDAGVAGSTDYLLTVACGADGAVRGYVCYGPTPMTDATYDLYWIVVHAEARGLGVARQLLAALELDVRARGGRHVRVETSQTEAYGAARQLYARAGYPEVARLANFYAPGDDLITYYKTL